MKIIACLLPLAGLLMLGACNSPSATKAEPVPRAAAAPAPDKKPAKKIVGYSNEPQASPGYGDDSGPSGGGGHHH